VGVHAEVGSRAVDELAAERDEIKDPATVNPIFTWVRLAQRTPVRVRIDQTPAGMRLVAGKIARWRSSRGARDPPMPASARRRRNRSPSGKEARCQTQ
jgi:multidrug resistance efflux pump